jgi:hypothetical protein
MPSYATQTALVTLRRLRVGAEEQAERRLAAALAAEAAARAEETRLAGAVGAARDRLAEAQIAGSEPEPMRAADARARRRYWARLESQVAAASAAVAAHRAGPLAEAIGRTTSARAVHRAARRDREIVDKAIARREAAWRLETDRREEAARDDLPARPLEDRR